MSIPLQNEIHYPESDGRPMGETEIHALRGVELRRIHEASAAAD